MRLRLLAALCLLSPAASARAQLPVPRLSGIFPCGARQGTTVECSVFGSDIADATGLYFSHPGIAAQPAGGDKFKVTVSAGVPVGPYDVRAVTPMGISSFRAFFVGDVPEAVEREPNDELAKAQRVALPAVVNGRIDKATDVDHYVFAAKKGQRVTVDCWAWRADSMLDGTLMVFDPAGRELAYSGDYYGKDPFLDFTAPADGDYTVKVWDFVYGGGKDSFYRLHVGSLPHLDAAVPAAVRPGTKSTVTFYGRNLPGGRPAPNGAAILGRPLEAIEREVVAPADPAHALALNTGEAIRPFQSSLDGMAYRVAGPEGASNPLFLAFTDDPIVLESEPNNDRASPQRLPVPCDVTGTFGAPGDRDYYAFSARKGERFVVEVFGQRQTGLIDPYLVGYDPPAKRPFAVNGGAVRNIGQLRFTTQTNDGRWDLTAGTDGEHVVQVRDLYYQQRGDPRFTYRLSVRRPRPDFRLVVAPNHDTQPDATAVGRGSRQWMDAMAFRQDGFDEPIRVEAKGLPPGVTCDPAVIAPGKTSAPLVFRAARDAAPWHGAIRVEGTAAIDGKEVVREARGGGLTWSTVNTPGIARMSDGIALAVRGPAPFSLTASPAAATAAAGGKVSIALKVERAADWQGDVQLSGSDLPQNATLALVTVGKAAAEGKVELVLPANLKPGPYTFTVNGAGQAPRDYGRKADPKEGKSANVRAVYPSNAITVTVEAPAKK